MQRRVTPCLSADWVVGTIRGTLPPMRSSIVRRAWATIDREGCGQVTVQELLSCLDVRRLPAVLSGQVGVDVAKRAILEGLDVCGERMGRMVFVLEETYARRRPRPVGALDTPQVVPAGRPRQKADARRDGDVALEAASRPPLIKPDAVITFADFEAFYTMVSTVTDEDDVFRASVEAAWVGHRHLREVVAGARASCTPRAIPHTDVNIRVLVTFEDGSSRLVTLLDNGGVDTCNGQAGKSTNQIWGRGAEIYPEVVRQLRAQGVAGIKNIKLAPF